MYGAENEIGIIDMAIDQLFLNIEQTNDRQFLMKVNIIKLMTSALNLFCIHRY